jgi:hypothetical protein
MATLSRKTLGIVIRCMERWSRSEIDLFLYEHGVPNELIQGDSKKSILLSLFRVLEDREEYGQLLQTIVSDVLARLSADDRLWLQESLQCDGFVTLDGTLAPDVPVAEENRTALAMLIHKHADDLDAKTLSHHLENTLDLFKNEKWDVSVGQARNFVEQLLDDIAKAIAKVRKESPDLSKPLKVREYLQACGFFDDSEKKKLVDGVYGYFSKEGSHPGISEQSTARVCMHILWAFAYYILEKFEEWKKPNVSNS